MAEPLQRPANRAKPRGSWRLPTQVPASANNSFVTEPTVMISRSRAGIFQRRAAILAAVIVAAAASGPKAETKSAPAPHYSAPASMPHFGGGAAPHFPGGMNLGGSGGGGGGVHLPSNMRPAGGESGGAHLPSNMHAGGEAGGVHLPSNMRPAGGAAGGAHLPSNMRAAGGENGGAHLPSSMAGHNGAMPHTASPTHYGTATQHGAVGGARYADHGRIENRGDARGAAGARESVHEGVRPGAQAARHDPFAGHAPTEVAMHHQERALQVTRHDVRLGGTAHLNTRGLETGLAIRQPPRPFLRPEPHRDVAADRSFVSRHEGDFHTRRVSEFSTRERSLWRAGLWRNEWHYGRRGWWWEVDGVWYAYPAPIWPYPEEVTPLVVYETPVVDGPDYSVEEGLPPVAVATTAPAETATATADTTAGATQGPDAAPGSAPAGAPSDPNSAATGTQGASQGDAPANGAQPATPPATLAADTSGGGHIMPLPAPPVGWYHCEGPTGYYPGLDACGNGWTLVQTPPLPGEQ